MENVIHVELRKTAGKGAARKTRGSNRLPGILYGHKRSPVAFSVDPKALERAVASSGQGRNTVLQLKGLDRDALALVKDLQIHPVRHSWLHIDLIEIREDEEVAVEVPVVLMGKAAGAIDGGIVQAIRRDVRVYCKPLSIPKVIEVDVTPLKIGDVIHVKDVVFPSGTRSATPGHLTVCTVVLPQEEKAPAVAVEGAAVPAVAGETPAPAGGAAPPAAGATAPAADAKKEKEKKA